MLDIKTLESWLWEAACKIRGPVDAPKYKDFILTFIFSFLISSNFGVTSTPNESRVRKSVMRERMLTIRDSLKSVAKGLQLCYKKSHTVSASNAIQYSSFDSVLSLNQFQASMTFSGVVAK